MQFVKKPEDGYLEYFISQYYEKCKLKSPKIEAIFGKWDSEDLVPGLCDFDTRFVCSNDASIQDWCKMADDVSDVHLDICLKHKEYARLLEHLPGINLTWIEYTDKTWYYPEYRQWTCYHNEKPSVLDSSLKTLDSFGWSSTDEKYFLSRFLTYFGRYDRTIDIPINVGIYIDKYPLHSRIMHYFAPPVQAALIIIERRIIKGKLEAFRLAAEKYKELNVFGECLELIGKHYEEAALYSEKNLVEFEDRLEAALNFLLEELKMYITIIPEESLKSIPEMKKALYSIGMPCHLAFLDKRRFARLFKGRMKFYLNAPGYFDCDFLINAELKRGGDMFFFTPFRIYWELKTGEKVENPVDILDYLTPEILTQKEVNAARAFAKIMDGCFKQEEIKERIRQLIEIYDDFYSAYAKLKADIENGYL